MSDKNWPNFLGIGSPRCGTTWLHAMLSGHPEVYVPTRRKEIEYFRLHFELGLDWYASFFDQTQAVKAKAIGEITPQYLIYEEAAARISDFGHVKKLIINVRKPLDQFRSFYNHVARYNNTTDPTNLIQLEPHLFDASLYHNHIVRYQKYFSNEQMLIIFLDDIGKDSKGTLNRIADFLGVDPSKFPLSKTSDRVNQGGIPKFASLFRVASATQRMLRRNNLDWIVNAVLASGIKERFAGKTTVITPLEEQFASRASIVNEDIRNLELLTGRDLASWYVVPAETKTSLVSVRG